MRIVGPAEFESRLQEALAANDLSRVGVVTGPGRSGAVAAVYASHALNVPFIPYGCRAPDLGRLLLIDTARESGRTLRKAARRYSTANPIVIAVFEEPPRVAFWYEAPKPQRFRHERNVA
jgi:adenine/guanine phosphoribosyltransferase-like PRPP-binding protein